MSSAASKRRVCGTFQTHLQGDDRAHIMNSRSHRLPSVDHLLNRLYLPSSGAVIVRRRSVLPTKISATGDHHGLANAALSPWRSRHSLASPMRMWTVDSGLRATILQMSVQWNSQEVRQTHEKWSVRRPRGALKARFAGCRLWWATLSPSGTVLVVTFPLLVFRIAQTSHGIFQIG